MNPNEPPSSTRSSPGDINYPKGKPSLDGEAFSLRVEINAQRKTIGVEVVDPDPQVFEYAFYLRIGAKKVNTLWYSPVPQAVWRGRETTTNYNVVAFRRRKNSNSQPETTRTGDLDWSESTSISLGPQHLRLAKRSIRLKEYPPNSNSYFRPHPEVFRYGGPIVDRNYVMRTDEEGFIVTGNSYANTPNTRRLVLLGGSFVESMYADEQRRFPAQVERMAHESGHDISTHNGGYSGSTLLHVVNHLLNKVLQWDRDKLSVCIFPPTNDVLALSREGTYWAPHQHHANVLPLRSGSIVPRPFDTSEATELMQVAISICQTAGIPVSVVTTPYREDGYEGDPFMTIRHANSTSYEKENMQMRTYTDAIKQVTLKNNVEHLDLHAALGGKSRFFYDGRHLTVEGMDAAALTLHNFFSKIGLYHG